MKKLFPFLFLLLTLIDFECPASAQPAEGINVKIDSVDMGIMKDDVDPSEFSLKIMITNHGKDASNWYFGFYMVGAPLSKFQKGPQNFNPRIIRRICDSQNHCSNLKYEKAQSVTNVDWSQGYTTIHSPEKDFTLLSGETYTIEFLHINQWGGWNVSYFPQNFFLLTDEITHNSEKKLDLHLLDTEFRTYTVKGYNQYKIDSEI